jgi:phosphate transport system permease protein
MKSNSEGLTSAVQEPRDADGESETQPQPREDEESAPQPSPKPPELEEKRAKVSGGKPVKTRRSTAWDFRARGEPFVWGLGGALVIGIFMIVGFLIFVLYNGMATFYPKPIEVVSLRDGGIVAGEHFRTESYRPGPEVLQKLSEEIRNRIKANKGFADRTLYRTGNYDLYNQDFRWIPDFDTVKMAKPKDLFFFERLEWGPFIGRIKSVDLNGKIIKVDPQDLSELATALDEAATRRERLKELESKEMGRVNYVLEQGRFALKKIAMQSGEHSPAYERAEKEYKAKAARLNARHQELAKEASGIKTVDAKYTMTLADVTGKEKKLKLSQLVRLYPANDLSLSQKLGIYFSRWREFLTQNPREANTEGGVMPAIFGTLCMTVLLALAVAPFGVVAALYLREYAKQGALVSVVRICVNNLAGVPSIVYGVFGLGFFAYVVGGSIDRLFFPERLPNPTFGTGGLLWASLTLALLTVPVVIVATEEALAAVPQSMREGSLACGASKWQTIKHIVLPRALPGIMTGLILAMARGAEEVAPLMLVGVVKLAPELPIDSFFPYIHLERSFMHLGFHIYDLGFQSRNSEAARPMVYVTTFLLIALVFAMNFTSIYVRNRLKKKFFAGHF